MIEEERIGKKREDFICWHCGGDIRIRNPKGDCDHLHYPENCKICKEQREETIEIVQDRVPPEVWIEDNVRHVVQHTHQVRRKENNKIIEFINHYKVLSQEELK